MLLFQNDQIIKLLDKQFNGKSHTKGIGMSLINSYIASALEGILLQSNTGARFDFTDILCSCAPLDSLKMLEVHTNPFFTDFATDEQKRAKV